jgi:hypothetical protein
MPDGGMTREESMVSADLRSVGDEQSQVAEIMTSWTGNYRIA